MECILKIVKCFIRCKRCFDRWTEIPDFTVLESPRYISAANLPWMWVGAEMHNNSIITVTDTLNNAVQSGDLITSTYLKNLTKLSSVKRWLYLDSMTLKEDEIPTEGILIV